MDPREKRTGLQVLLGRVHHLHGNELESAVLEALDDDSDQTTLDAIGLRWEEKQTL